MNSFKSASCVNSYLLCELIHANIKKAKRIKFTQNLHLHSDERRRTQHPPHPLLGFTPEITNL